MSQSHVETVNEDRAKVRVSFQSESRFNGLDSVAIEVSSRPKLTGIVRGKAFLHVLRRRLIGYPDSRKRTR
ncbi:hypothetical protein TNCV_1792011 [Trichonephila clavipes]|nr:hypothetical protein TNCV_1792011 [Trichonephila clavipes]